MKKTVIIFIGLIILLSLFASAKQNSITLLALVQEKNETRGSTADLTLEIREGNERVFLDTFPLTKIGTQISMRFAQQFICQEYDCSKLDFIYTIMASPGIVGGPSAGAASAILTKSMLENKELDRKIAITGTINAGGLIGQVGGVKEKIEAAAFHGFKKVLIPKGTRTHKNQGKNLTLDLVDYGEVLGIKVTEINTFDEAYAIFTGEKIKKTKTKLEIDPQYQKIMKTISTLLCQRSASLSRKINTSDLDNSTTQKLNRIKNFTRISQALIAKKEYYSAASYCFRTNIEQKTILNQKEEFNAEKIQEKIRKINTEIEQIEEELSRQKINTITDLQTYMIIRNRILEAKDTIKKAVELNNTNRIAYAEERIFSVKGWLELFDIDGRPFDINQDALKKSCITKIKEAEERLNYAKSFIPYPLQNVRDTIDTSFLALEKKEYAVCLYEASSAKAEVDIIISSTGLGSTQEAQELIVHRLNVVKNALIKAQEKEIFPLIGYIYFEYAKSLTKQGDTYSGLLFSGYALELSDVDMYFKEKGKKKVFIFNREKYGNLLLAFSLGLIAGVSYINYKRRKK